MICLWDGVIMQMSKQVFIELDKKIVDGELLIYKDNMLKSVEIHQLLPELKGILNDIQALKNENDQLKQTIADLAKVVKEK